MPDVVLIAFAVAAAVAFLIGALAILEGDARDVETLPKPDEKLPPFVEEAKGRAADDSRGRHERRARVWRPALHRAAVAVVDGLIGAALALLFVTGTNACPPRFW